MWVVPAGSLATGGRRTVKPILRLDRQLDPTDHELELVDQSRLQSGDHQKPDRHEDASADDVNHSYVAFQEAACAGHPCEAEGEEDERNAEAKGVEAGQQGATESGSA